MSRTRGTISRTHRSPPVNRPGGGVHRWYVSQGSEATGLFGRVTVVLGGAQPADHRCAQFSLKRCGNSYLAKHWRRIHHSWRRRDAQWRSGPGDVLGVPFGEGCVSTANLTGRAGRVLWHRLRPSGGALDNSTSSGKWWPSDHRWTRLLHDLRGPAGAGTVQVTRHVDAAGMDCGGAVCATNITRRRVADTDPSRFLVCSSRVNFRSQIV